MPEWVGYGAPAAVDEEHVTREIDSAVSSAPTEELARQRRERSENWFVWTGLLAVAAMRTSRREEIERWIDDRVRECAALLRFMRKSRAGEIAIAKARDAYEEAGLPGKVQLARFQASGALRCQDRDVMVEIHPVSRVVEAVRASGELKRRAYDDRGILEAVNWQWLRDAQERFNDEQLARALILADDESDYWRTYQQRDPAAASKAAMRAIGAMRAKMKGSPTDPHPHE